MRWQADCQGPKEGAKAEASPSCRTKSSNIRNSLLSLTVRNRSCLIFSRSIEGVTMATSPQHGLSWSCEAGAARARSNSHRTSLRIRVSLYELGKVAGISATCLRLRSTQSMTATESSTCDRQTHRQAIGRNRFGSPNPALLCTSVRVNCPETLIWCPVRRASQALFEPFGAPPQGPLYRYTKGVQE